MSRKHLVFVALSFLAVLSATAQAATAAPTSLVATPASSSSITLTWVSNSSGSGFVVERSLDNRHYAAVGTTGANVTTFIDSGLAQNQLYLYRVKATGSQGDSDYSNWNFAVTRANVLSTVMPSDPAAVWSPGGGAMLSWSDTFDGETGFKVERSDKGGGFAQIAVTGPGATSYTDTAVLADTTYTYRIRATSAQADSAYSRTAQVNHYGVYSGDLFVAQGGLSYSNLLAPPTNLSASAISTSQINLTWQDNSNNETGFAVLRSFDNVHFQLLGTTAANVTTYSDSTVIFGVTYYYRVVATGMTSVQIFSALDPSAVASAQSQAFNALLPAPSNLTFAAIPGGGVALTWQDNSTNESGFAIERSVTPSQFAAALPFQFSRIATVGPNVTSFTDPSGGNNYYRVQALSPSGDSVYSPPAGPSDPYYLLKPPPATPTLTAAMVSATHVNLSWSPANMWPIRVERSIDGVNFSAAGMAGGNQNAFQDCSAPPGTLCSYRIQLTHYATNPYSNVATAATPGLSAPAAPTGVSATGVSPTQINVKWAAVDVSVTSTTVERSTNGGATFAVLATLPPSNVSFSDAGLPAGATASYRLRVNNPVGTSGYSNTATAGTLGAYPAVTVTSEALGQHTRLTIQGTPANDTILVSQAGNAILVSVNGGAAASYAGPFGELVVKGGGGGDNITVDSSVSVEQVLVYGDGGKGGNNVLNALGSGKQTIVAVGGGCDICTGNGINTSYWVDEAGVDTVNASQAEIAAFRVHRIKQFCQPYSFDPTNANFVSKVLDGQTWPEPFSYTFNFGLYLQRYPDNSLWGRSPVMFDINASFFFSCGYMAPFQSRVDKHPDVVQEIMVDLGDGTYAAQVGEPGDQAYARVDGYVAPGQCSVLGPSGDQWYLIWEKFFSMGNMNWNEPASVMGAATTTPINLQADGAAVYSAVRTALDQKKVLSCFTDGLNRYLDVPKSLYQMTHCYSIVEAYQDGAGNPCFILRNIYGIRDYSDSANVNNLLTINPAQGLFTLNLKQLQNNLYGCIAQDCQFGGGTQNQPPVINSPATATPNPVTAGQSTTLLVAASDADGDTLSDAWAFGDGGTATGASATHAYAAAGSYTATVTVSDGQGNTASSSVTVTVNAVVVAPVITSTLTASGTVGTAFSYSIIASNSPTSFNATGLPAGLSVNTSTGVISGTPTTAGTSNIAISATNAAGTGSATLVLTINPAKPAITSALTATGTVGTAFSYTITASNSPTSYNAAGLPTGLSVNTSTGVISGTPTTAGTSNVTISAVNAGGTGSATLVLMVNAVVVAPSITTQPANQTVNAGQTATFTVSASGRAPLSYQWQRGTSNISGANNASYTTPPTAAGDNGTTYRCIVSNSAGSAISNSATLTVLTINNAAPVITSPLTATGTVGVSSFDYSITATNSPTSYNATNLPAGLSVFSFSAFGAILGTPTVSGTFNVTISATNAGGTGTATLVLTINAANTPPAITSPLTATGVVSTAFTYAITASNGPTSFSATGLPGGLTVNTATGVITGTPTAAGASRVTVSATNSAGTGTATLTLTINSSSGGLVLYWKLDETSGATASDSSGNGNTGTLNGGSWTTGKINGGLSLNGASQYAITSTNLSSQFAGGSVTIALWFKATAAGVIVDELGQPGINTNWHDSQIEVLSDGTVYARVWNMPAVSLGKVTFGQWTHAALRYDNAAQKLDGFLNGVQSAGSVSGSKQWPGSLYYALGATDTTNVGSGAFFNGVLDDLHIYNRALSATEVATLAGGSGGSASATYVTTDSTTQGNWKGVYGIEGSAIQADSANYPAYASVAFVNDALYTWTSSTSDVRAPLKYASTTDRIASCWYSGNGVGTTFSIDLNLTDGAVHRVALYSLDWDSTTRTQTFEIDDAGTGAILDGPRPLSNYNGGDYEVWDIKGHVTIKLVCTGGYNAVVSAIFFGVSSATAPSITTQPASQTVSAGQTATFSVAASGTAPLSYQWQKNGVNITSATSASYATPTTTTADSGSTFDCAVRNSAGSVTSTSATLTVNSVATGLAQGGFEVPNVGPAGNYGSFSYATTGSAWTFTGGAGISANGSGFTSGNPNAPEGVQVAFIQGTGSFSQTASFAAGTYTLSFQAAQRANWQSSSQTFRVLVDNQAVGDFHPASGNYETDTTSTFTVTAGSHNIVFVGLNPNGGDNTAFIDNIAIAATSASSAPANSTVLPAPSPTPEPMSITVQKLAGAVSFNAKGQDSVSLSGAIPGLPSISKLSGATVQVWIGGEPGTFKLDGKGRAKSSAGTLTLTSTGAIKVALKGGNWSKPGSPIDATATLKNSKLKIGAMLLIDGTLYTANVNTTYTSKAHVGGKFHN